MLIVKPRFASGMVFRAKIPFKFSLPPLFCLTEAALSYQIRSLEKELDAALFRRTTTQVAITEAGRALLPHAEDLYRGILNARTAAHGITDETFAVNLNAFETETDPRWTCEEALGLNITSCAVWSLSNALGCYAAAYLNPPTELVSYLLIAMFLGIWVNYLTDRKMIITGLVSGLLAILLSQIVPYKLHIVLATLAASGAACYITERHAGGADNVR